MIPVFPSIKAKNLSTGYSKSGKSAAIINSGLNFELYPGELTCLLGTNGAGKSTLLKTLSGIQKPIGGEIFILDKPANKYSPADMSKTVSVVLTERVIVADLKVYDIVALGRQPYTDFLGRLTDNDIFHINEAIDKTGISHIAGKHISSISDGERQKTMIAKALAQSCPIIILDEPTAFLDLPSRFEMMCLLHKLASDTGKSILLSTHDLESALLLSDRLWLLPDNSHIVTGTPEDLVLSGVFGKHFERDNLNFEKTTGNFRFTDNNAIPVTLTGKGDLKYWISNALIRNGYQPVANPCEITVEIPESDSICIILSFPSGEKSECSTISSMIEELKTKTTQNIMPNHNN